MRAQLIRLFSVDEERLIAFYQGLSPDDLAMRFGGPMKDERIREYVQGMNWWQTVVLGVEIDGELLGVGELIQMEEGWPPSAEAAITVEPGWRTCGLGTELLRGLIRYARNRWIARLWMICLADNVAMRKIASKCGASLTLCSSQVEARITPPYPTPFTMWDEAVEEARGLARSITLRTGLAAPEDARREVASATG